MILKAKAKSRTYTIKITVKLNIVYANCITDTVHQCCTCRHVVLACDWVEAPKNTPKWLTLKAGKNMTASLLYALTSV